MSQIHHKLQDTSKSSGLSNQLSNSNVQEETKITHKGGLFTSLIYRDSEADSIPELNEEASEEIRMNNELDKSISELSHIFLPSSDNNNFKQEKKTDIKSQHSTKSQAKKPKFINMLNSNIQHNNYCGFPQQTMQFIKPSIVNTVAPTYLAHNLSNCYTYYDHISYNQFQSTIPPYYLNSYTGINNFHHIPPYIGCYIQSSGNVIAATSKNKSGDIDSHQVNITNEVNNIKIKPINNASNSSTVEVHKFGKYEDVAGFLSNCNAKLKYINSVKGSKCLKKMLEFTNPGDIKKLFNKILQYLPQIITNNFGNYFIQEIITYISKSDRIKVWENLTRKLKIYSTHQFANHCIQALVEMAEDLEEEKKIISYLIPHFEDLAFNPNGTHILQKVIISFADSTKGKLIECIYNNFEALIFDSLGVCLIKKYIISLKEKDSQKKHEFISFILHLIPRMITDMFGHYGILCIIQEWDSVYSIKIFDITWNNLLIYSSNKYGSRIVERLIELSTKVRYLYISDLKETISVVWSKLNLTQLFLKEMLATKWGYDNFKAIIKKMSKCLIEPVGALLEKLLVDCTLSCEIKDRVIDIISLIRSGL